MSNTRFGNYAVINAIKHEFEKDPQLNLSFRAPNAADELKVAQYVSRQIPMPGSTPPYRYPNTMEVMMFEIATLYDGSNIENSPTPASVPMSENIMELISTNTSFAAVYSFISCMPLTMLREVWIAMSAAIPGWGPEKKA